jgi:phage transcriptional regulator
MNRLKKLRQEKGLSQKALTEMLNDKSDFTVTLRTVQNWEANKTPIKSAPAQILADYFGVTVPYLLGYHEETLAFEFPNDEKEFYKETQRLIDIADNIEQDSEIFPQVQQIKNMAILVRSSREKIKNRYGQKVYEELNNKETDFEFYKYLTFLLDKKEYLKSDLLVYLSLLDSSDKEIIFKMITEFKKQ